MIILKGNLFAHTIYKDVGYKRMNDFDILIKQEDWEKAQDVYHSLGFIPLGFGWSGEKQKVAKFSHVGMSYISPDFSCIIGTQWGLKSPTAAFKVNITEAWKTSRDFNFYDLRVKQLSPEYNLLHLVLHLGIYKCGIRDLMDVYNLILKDQPDPSKFAELAKQSNAIEKAIFTLELAGCCADLNPDYLQALRKHSQSNGFISRRLKKRKVLQEQCGDLQNSYNDYFQDIEKRGDLF